MTICHKLDVIPDLLVVHAHKPGIYQYQLVSNTSGSFDSRWYLTLMAYPRNLIAQTGGDDNCLQAIGIELCQRVPGDNSGALMATLNRTASID